MPNNFILDVLSNPNLIQSPYDINSPQGLEMARRHAYSQLGPIGPIRHWTQGLDHALRALSGRMDLNKIESVSKGIGARQANAAKTLFDTLNPTVPGSVTVQPSQQPSTVPVKENKEVPISSSNLWNSPEYISRFIQVESGGNPTAMTGSYRGLGQFSREEEKELGLNDDNWTNPQAQHDAILQVNKRNYNYLVDKLGREPSKTELYLAHQQGRGGVLAHLSKPGNPAWVNMLNTAEGLNRLQKDGEASAVAWAKKAIAGNIPSDSPLKNTPIDQVTSAQFLDLWKNKFEGGNGAPVKIAQNMAAPVTNDAASSMPSPTNDIAPQEAAAAWGGGTTGAIPPSTALSTPAPPTTQIPTAALPSSAPQQTAQLQPQLQNGVNLPTLPFNTPQFSPQIMSVLSDPFVDPQFKNTIMQEMIKRTQPKEIDLGAGGTGFFDPRTRQWIVAPKVEKSAQKVGDIEIPRYDVVDMQKGVRRLPTQGTTSAPAQQQGYAQAFGDKDRPATRLGELPFDENWDADTLSRWQSDRKLMDLEKEEKVKQKRHEEEKSYEERLDFASIAPKAAVENAKLAREIDDVAAQWKATLPLNGADKVYAGIFGDQYYDTIRSLNEFGKTTGLFGPIKEGETTVFQLRRALGIRTAAILTRRSDPQPAQILFNNFLRTVPGPALDEATANLVVMNLEKIAERDRRAGILATQVHPFKFMEEVEKLDKDLNLQLPSVGKIEENGFKGTVVPDNVPRANKTENVPKKAIDMLKNNPDLRDAFKQKYGWNDDEVDILLGLK